ncbi:hypothetical protein [Gordonibacter sp. An230]|uniref:hypothetical protein n=1 Tax=Gordonibacter sp. An230 TaxID=1965592 RepID=UPI001EF44C61|nr:hypothetical protein [Gordonibacter sp. An230]
MLERDYLMRILLQFAEVVRRSWTKAEKERDPRRAADMLEDAVGEAVDMDGEALLSLAPDSVASVVQVSGVDPRVVDYVARSLLLASRYLRDADEHDLADLREKQARALADAYGLDLPDDPEDAMRLLDEIDGDVSEEAFSTMEALGFEAPPEKVEPSLVETLRPDGRSGRSDEVGRAASGGFPDKVESPELRG